MLRAPNGPSSCGKAVVDITGVTTTSNCWKNRCQAQRIWVRASFRRCQSRARMVWARSTWAAGPWSAGSSAAAWATIWAYSASGVRALIAACSRPWNTAWLCAASKPGRAASSTCAPCPASAWATASTRACTAADTGHSASVRHTATRSARVGSVRPGRSTRRPRASITSGGDIRRRAVSRSCADRASGPITEMSVGVSTPPSAWPRIGSRFQVGFRPNTPQ